ncbi:hypothetical protein HKX48_005487 [Thoreauomyces humboldtii]|nr:hypothetical protein HKX48_005487 [Thoreauomyces humboldtii]
MDIGGVVVKDLVVVRNVSKVVDSAPDLEGCSDGSEPNADSMSDEQGESVKLSPPNDKGSIFIIMSKYGDVKLSGGVLPREDPGRNMLFVRDSIPLLPSMDVLNGGTSYSYR